MMRYWNDSWFCGPGSYFHGPWGIFINLAFWLAIIFFAVWLVRSLLEKRNGHQTSSPSPSDVLRRRYAAGEIDREAFERIKQDIAT